MPSITWDASEFEREIERVMKDKLAVAAESLAGQIKKNISIGRPASKPGEYPHVDTGTLRNSIFWEQTKPSQVKVGASREYGLYLEVGTKHMAPRPYLRRTLAEIKPQIKRILEE